ncbi:MAG TPA: CDP-diacylglycerol--serine O-phosphatidyltransferase [Bryobacteraceae bacterium]|nr:CDP-diacylglycerol--serine O-phosphatidyltransferase [Bryobacteraceae bacterium]
MKVLRLSERLIDPRSPDRRPRRAAYALPTLFTAGSVFLGFYALIEFFQGAMQTASNLATGHLHFQTGAVAIGVAVFLDGLDGRIARMTNTVSDFGREMDSLADVITFGIAPAVLAFAWGVEFVEAPARWVTLEQVRSVGYFASFVFLLCGAMRLARFNIQKNPVLKNPGRPDRKYFAGLPIPSGAAAVAAVVYFQGSEPLRWWGWSVAWLALLALLSFLMVSTWRYPSFKDLSLTRPRSPVTVVLMGILIYLIWYYSQEALLVMAGTYVMSGIAIRLGGIARRVFRRAA